MKARIASHLAALAAGIALAVGLSKTGSPPKSGATETGAGEMPATKSDRSGRAGGKSTTRPIRAAEFQAAWDALVSKELSFDERLQLQREILERWAEVDLEAALDAAMAEAWDNDQNPGFIVSGTSGHLLIRSFRQAFIERPLDAWSLISSGKYGVGSQIIRDQWIDAISSSDGPLVISMLGEIPPSQRVLAINSVMNSAQTDPERIQGILAKLTANPPSKESDEWLKLAASRLPGDGDPVALREQWVEQAKSPGRTLALMSWAASLRMADAATLEGEWETIPADQRGEAVKAVIQGMDYRSKALTTAMDLAMEAGEWEFLAANGPELARIHAINHDPAALAEWAMELPERPETVEIFHRSIDRYIGEDLPRAKEWLEALPADDWHRDRGFAEYSQQALHRQRNPAESRWALDQIQNPQLKAEAEGWRRSWEGNNRAN